MFALQLCLSQNVAASLPRIITSSRRCHKRERSASKKRRKDGLKEERRKMTIRRRERHVPPAMTWDKAVALCDMFSYGGCCCHWERERRRRKWRLGLEDDGEGKMIDKCQGTVGSSNYFLIDQFIFDIIF